MRFDLELRVALWLEADVKSELARQVFGISFHDLVFPGSGRINRNLVEVGRERFDDTHIRDFTLAIDRQGKNHVSSHTSFPVFVGVTRQIPTGFIDGTKKQAFVVAKSTRGHYSSMVGDRTGTRF